MHILEASNIWCFNYFSCVFVELTSPHGNANPSTSLAVAGSGAIGMSAAATITSHVTANDVSDSSLPPMRGVTEAGVAVDIDRWPWR